MRVGKKELNYSKNTQKRVKSITITFQQSHKWPHGHSKVAEKYCFTFINTLHIHIKIPKKQTIKKYSSAKTQDHFPKAPSVRLCLFKVSSSAPSISGSSPKKWELWEMIMLLKPVQVIKLQLRIFDEENGLRKSTDVQTRWERRVNSFGLEFKRGVCKNETTWLNFACCFHRLSARENGLVMYL